MHATTHHCSWLGDQVSKITATGSHSTEVGLQMKIKHLEAELRRQKAETHQLKYALKDAAYENLSSKNTRNTAFSEVFLPQLCF